MRVPTFSLCGPLPVHHISHDQYNHQAHKDRKASEAFDKQFSAGCKIAGKNYGGAPQLLVRQPTPGAPEAEKAKRAVVTIDKFAWADEDEKVKIYVTLDGLGDLPDESVTLDWSKTSLELRVVDLIPGKDHVLTIAKLHDDVDKATCKKKKDRVTITLKKSVSVTWYELKKKD